LIAADLAIEGVQIEWDRELIALIAYLQRLGRGPQFSGAPTAEVTPPAPAAPAPIVPAAPAAAPAIPAGGAVAPAGGR
jgi:cytochrome c oxidase cbb3-type subunit I/II